MYLTKQNKAMKVTVTRTNEKDVDSTNITVKIVKNGLGYNASGHINNRTNWVHLTADEEIDEVGMDEAEIYLDEIEKKIEKRQIQLN